MISEEQLMLYFYNDGLSLDERDAIETAISEDPALAERYADLQQALASLGDADISPAPEHLKYQWHEAIDRAARLEHGKAQSPNRRWPWLAFGSSIAAGLLITFAINSQLDNVQVTKTPSKMAVKAPVAKPQSNAFERGLQVHLQQASSKLDQMGAQTGAEQSRLIAQIIAQNRIFEQAATDKNADDVARLMRALEPVLLRLSDQQLSPREADALRMQLTFELSAVLTKIQQTTSDTEETI